MLQTRTWRSDTPVRRPHFTKITSSSSSAHYSPLLDIGLSNCFPSHWIFDFSHPAPANRPAQIVTSPGLRVSYTTFIETWSPLQNSLSLTVVFSTADMTSSLPLQRANTVCYVGDFSFLSDHLVSDSIPQRNPEHSSFHSSLSDLELVDQLSAKLLNCEKYRRVRR
jgi:hypothetical protein